MVTFADLSATNRHTEDEYQKCVDFFKARKDSFRYAANYIIVGSKLVEEKVNQPCHAGIANGLNNSDVVKLVGTNLGFGTCHGGMMGRPGRKIKGPVPDSMFRFAEWLLNDSHFSKLIVNKPEHRNTNWLLNEGGGLIVSAHLPQPVFQMMMILSRTFTERCSIQFDKWEWMVKLGCDPHFAYNVAFCVSNDDMVGAMPVLPRTGHTTMYLLNISQMSMFVNGDLGDSFEKTPYSKLHSIYGCDKIFGQQKCLRPEDNFIGELIHQSKLLQDKLRAFRNKDTALETYRPPNPFKISAQVLPPLKPNQVTYQELFEVVVPFVVEERLFQPS